LINMIDYNDFYDYMTKSFNLKESTAKMYESAVRQFFNFVKKRPDEVEVSDLINFFRYLYDNNYSSSYMVVCHSALKTFYDYLIYIGLIDRNIPREFKRRFRTERKFPVVMTEDELYRIVRLPFDYRYFEDKAMQESSIMVVLATTGIRIGELKTIEFCGDTIKVYGKRSKERYVPIIHKFVGEDLSYEAWEYFLDNNLKNISVRSVQKIVERYRKKLGTNKKITPHTFRHTYATLLLKNGVDLLTLKNILGHDSIYTTEIYIHMNNEDLLNKLKDLKII